MRSPILLAALLFAATIHGAEVPVAPVAAGPAYGSQSILAAGSNGDGYLVVWQDVRDGGYANLAASRVTADGTMLDPFGIVLAPLNGYLQSVHVFGEGDGFRVEYVSSLGSWQRRVHPDGSLDALAPLDADEPFQHPAIGSRVVLHATDGSEHLYVGRRTTNNGSQLVIVRTNAVGAILGGPVLSPPIGGYRGTLVELIWTGQDYGLLFVDDGVLRAQRISRDGTLSGTVLPIDTKAWYPISAASRGDGGFAVVYSRGLEEIHVVQFDARGTQTRVVVPGRRGAIASDGHDYLLAWDVGQTERERGVAVGTLTSIASEPRPEDTRSVVAQKAFNLDRSSEARLFVWYEDDGTARGRIMARHPDAAPAGAFPVWPSTGDQHAPAVARIGDVHLVVWYEDGEVKALLLDLFDEPLMEAPVTIGKADRPPFSGYTVNERDIPPAVVWTGRYFLIAWSSGPLHLARMTAGGVLLDTHPAAAAVDAWQDRPVLVRAGTIAFLLWQEGGMEKPCSIPCFASPATIRALRLDATGQPLDAEPLRISNTSFSTHPDGVWDGRLLLATWVRDGQMYGRYVDPYGNTFDPFIAGARPKPWVERVEDGVPRIYLVTP